MKTSIRLMTAALIVLLAAGCGSMNYKKMKSGLVYKLIPGGGKDSIAKPTNVVKIHFIRKVNDSLFYTSYDKMPNFIPLNLDPSFNYSPVEVLFLMRKGDSAVVVESGDSLLKKGLGQQMPFLKKGDRIITYMKVLEVYNNDSLARKDFEAEMAKDKPRQEQELKEIQAKEKKARLEQYDKDLVEWKKSGEVEKQDKEVEAYLKNKNLKASKTEQGTYIIVKQKGSGVPVQSGKYLAVKYAGRLMTTDSVFEANIYVFQVGLGNVIRGWDDGLMAFNEGGTGTLFVPGYQAYGMQPGPGGKPFEALVFDVQVLKVSDSRDEATATKRIADSLETMQKLKAQKKQK
jgi:FKBP-type peptidyl-prolyl cis-trans isomerase